MSEDNALMKRNPGDKTVEVIAGQHHKFMLIPIMEEETVWFTSGPTIIGVESRAFGKPGEVHERGASVHVFDGDTREEWLRFDCFDNQPHYHYILQEPQHNIVWGYDTEANGPMIHWIIDRLQYGLPAMLRRAGAKGFASRAGSEPLDRPVLKKIEKAMVAARERTFPGTDMIQPSIAWYNRWKDLHPQFNTVDY